MSKLDICWQLPFLINLFNLFTLNFSCFLFIAIFILASSLIAQPLQAQETNLLKVKKVKNATLKTVFASTESPNNSKVETKAISAAKSLLTVSPPIGSLDSLILPVAIAEKTANNLSRSITVKRFEVVGSTVFSQQQLQAVTEPFVDRPLSFADLFQARSAITQLYTENGYINSGAYIPPQQLQDGTVIIQVIEGELETINIMGTERLNPDYIRSRIEVTASKPVNIDSLLEALQRLRLDPLIENISAELSTGVHPGTSILDVQIQEADAFTIFTRLDNGRSPSVGTNRRSIGLSHGNLLGFGDRFDFVYENTDGSDSFVLSYAIPTNARDGNLRLAFGTNSNKIIEEPFNPLDIQSNYRFYELSFRQPLILKPTQELALGLSFSRQDSKTSLLDTPFPLSRGADEDGKTKISAVRFWQEWVNRNEQQVIALRSQFSVGLDLFDVTLNKDAPDSSFFAWRGQAQWVRRLDEDFLFILRGDIQLTPQALVPLEQFRLGGIDRIRGYRQDLIIGDNGVLASAEIRIPIARIRSIDGVIQLTPFVDIGKVWNSDDIEIDYQTLPAIGLGLSFTASDRFNARFDWGIPLVNVELESEKNSLQEKGIYFSINYNFF
ncbi:ShlB/FhaC/HecB family hemolysin secretion/activation protein [Pleurocapsales cyanobacterium LEGE 06147]|nr:ShlB/FhaC/HecB family hemolysin secretion/activation protein [Pleurocapsales cyanobacterium LEGE 06147]